jgi:hypothetical protein
LIGTIGTTILTFLAKWSLPEIDLKWDSKTHLYDFSFFEPFSLILALELAKNAYRSKNIFFLQKFDMGFIK